VSGEGKAKAGFVGVKPRGRKRVNAMTEATRRKLPAVPENMRPELEEARQRHSTRAASPGARVYKQADGSWSIDSPHRDLEAWEVMVCEAFGTRSHSVMWCFLDQVAKLCRTRQGTNAKGEFVSWVPDEYELNFILATIHSERPDTPLQAAMLAQMVANHLMQMRVGSDILGLHGDHVPADRAATFAKLTNAFANQTEVYLKLRGKAPPAQSVSVTYRKEAHVHHHSHKHAHLHENPPLGGGAETDTQPLEARPIPYVEKLPGPDSLPDSQPQSSPTLRSPDEAGNVLPMRRPEGEATVPTPRRSRRIGSAEG
jgi:hypothetical protein